MADARTDEEKPVERNRHPDFNTVQASRPDWSSNEWHYTKTKDPTWKWGQGANDGGESLKKNHIEIDPYEEGRPPAANYKLLISGIIPRPIGFISTVSKDGTSMNLAPMSYTQVVNHDPPVFCIGFSSSLENAKDSLRNLCESKECTINIISEHFVEAANATSINAPYGVSEWALTGLHPAPTNTVKAPRVAESIFSIEGKLLETREFESRARPGVKTGVLAIVEGTHFWVREDAINEEKSQIDPAVLKPISRLGGITFCRNTEGFEIPRPDYKKTMESSEEARNLAEPKA
ncbi:MAG: hypothetical protein M1839_004271 [Geoglossum umbratile]|nr:MAG: hypothetical protein M1839_004271 [Geoglossum umbratile]